MIGHPTNDGAVPALGRPHVHHRSTDSTNERAKALANQGAGHGTLVTADEQTAGRGRQGRSWSAAPGEALLMSLVLRDLEPRHALLPLMAALAVCETAEAMAAVPPAPAVAPTVGVPVTAAVRCQIKWPNDVWVERRKLSGILVEARPAANWAVLGIGLNTGVTDFPEELRETATTLRLARPDAALAPLIAALERWIAADKEAVLTAWRERDALLGSTVRWGPPGGRSDDMPGTSGAGHANEGVARGVDDEGALLVETAAGEVLALDAGEVHLAPGARP